MTTQRSTFAKLQRERAKKAKAAAKREKRHDRGGENDEIDLDAETTPEAPVMQYNTEDTIQQLDELHQRLEAGTIKFDDFEERKSELLSRLSVD